MDARLGYMVCIKPPKRVAQHDHDVGYLASVDAESKAHTTVPDILDTEYFTGLYPESYFARLNGGSVFKGGGLIAQKQHMQRGLGVESMIRDR